jgi:hypothetical protein
MKELCREKKFSRKKKIQQILTNNLCKLISNLNSENSIMQEVSYPIHQKTSHNFLVETKK